MPHFRFEHSRDVDTVFQLMTDPDALAARCEALGERDVKVEVSREGDVTKTTITLSPTGSGSVYEMDFQVTAKAPLIRKKLEAFIGGTALESLRRQHEHYARVLG